LGVTTKRNMMEPWIWLIIIVVGVGFVLMIPTIIKQRAMEAHLARLDNFSATQKVMGEDGNTGLAIDEQRKKICLIARRQGKVTSRVFSFFDLLASEIFEDGATITKTVRSSQIGGALIGGLALGGVGAIIGGLSGKTQTAGKVKKIELRLIVNDTKNPIHDINFLNSESKKDSYFYREAMKRARHWHALITVLIKQADMKDKTNVTNGKRKIQSVSIADEIKKLAELRDSGVLSDEEFQQHKARLLGKVSSST